MKIILLVSALFIVLSSVAQTATKADVEKAILSSWNRAATSSNPKQAAIIHSVKIGTAAKANMQDKIDGIPPGTTVTMAQIDFTVREYYSDRTIATHRVMVAKVYKDQFGDWAAKSNSMKTIETKSEATE